MCCDGACARRAFSLVELLLVVGVVFILIGISIPALSNAKRAALRARQLAQIQQCGTLLDTYIANADDWYPLAGPDQQAAMTDWYAPLVEAGLSEGAAELDRVSLSKGVSIAFALSGSMVSDPAYYTPDHGWYPDLHERPVSPVRSTQIQHPSSKGVLFTWRIGYDETSGREVWWCCLDLTLPAPLGFADGSAETLSVEQCWTSDPIRLPEVAGVPVASTWHGVNGRDR